MKKLVSLLTIVVLMLGLIAGCGSAPAPVPTTAPEEPAAEAPTEEEEAPTEEETPTEEEEAATGEMPDDPLGVVEVGPDDPIVLAYALVTSGPNSNLGIDSMRGIEIAMDDIGGEILGHEIELVGEDTLCSPEGGQSAANKLISNEQIVGIVGPTCSSAGNVMAPIIDEAGLVTISPSNTAPGLTDPATHVEGFLRTAHNDKIQGAIAAEYAYDELGLTSAATVHDGSVYAEQLANVFAERFEELGGEIVAQEAVNTNDVDMQPVLTSIASVEPELIYYPIFMPAGGFMTRQAQDIAGLEDVTLMGADGLFNPDYIEAAGDAVIGMYLSSPDLTSFGGGYEDFLAQHQEKYNEETLSVYHANAYDAAMLILQAVEEVAVEGEDDVLYIPRQALRDALYATEEYQGLTGNLTCDENGDCADPNIVIYEIVESDPDSWNPGEAEDSNPRKVFPAPEGAADMDEEEATDDEEMVEDTEAMTDTDTMDDEEAMDDEEMVEDTEAMTDTDTMDETDTMTDTDTMDEEATDEEATDEEAMTEEEEPVEIEVVAAPPEDDIGVVEIPEGEPFVLAYALVTSGPNSNLGIDSMRGIEIAMDDIGGEIMGHEIELVGEDTQCSPEGGQSAGNKLISNEQIIGIIGPTCSSAGNVMAPVIDEAGLVTISPSNTAPGLTDPATHVEGFLRTAHNDKVQGAIAAEYAYNELGLTSAATVHDGSVYAEQLANVFAERFEELGGEIVAQEAVNENDTDMQPVLTRIASLEPELIYYPIFMPAGGFMTRQARDVTGLEDIILMGADGLFNPDFVEAAGDAVIGMYLSSPDLTSLGGSYEDFLTKHQEKYNEETLSVYHANAYDAAMLILQAAEKVAKRGEDGTLYIPRQALRDALYETEDYQGLAGSLTCDEYGDCADPSIVVYEITDPDPDTWSPGEEDDSNPRKVFP